jgi:alkylation response protein AidB-like acyl-CoA dehydrogenase
MSRDLADGPASTENIAGFVEVISRASQRWWPRPAALDGQADDTEPQEDQLWQALVEAGATVVGLAEPLGGIGAGVLGAVAVVEAAARALHPASLLASAGLATPVLNALVGTPGEAQAQQIAERLTAGQRVTVATEPHLVPAVSRRLRGTVATVVDASRSDLIIVSAGEGATSAVLAIEASTPGVTVTPIDALDETRGFADVHLDLDLTDAEVLLEGDAAATVMRRATPQMCLAVAADSVGGAEQAVADTVEYAKVREQFGRAIGSFQGLRHLIVDTHVCVEQAAASLRHAARATEWESAGARIDAHIAKALATDAYIRAASTSVQVHGGIGFTRGLTAHLHVKRARANEAMLGTASWHRARLGDLLAHDVPADW